MRPELQQALEEAKSKRPEALERALSLLHRTAFSFSMKVCGHREDAEDTAQETLLRTAPQLAKFDSPKAIAVWLYKVARSRCLMSRRRSKFAPKQTLSLDELLPDRSELESLIAQGPTAEQQLMRKESAAELRRAVLKVPPDYRQVLVLHDMEELSTNEVAQVMGLREGTVRVRLHRARAFLRNQLAVKPKVRRGAKTGTSHCKQLFAALSDYLDGELDEGSCATIESHLKGCAPCEAYLDTLRETVRRCRQLGDDEAKTKLRTELRKLVQAACSAGSK